MCRCCCYPGAVSVGRSCCNPITYSSNSSIVVFLSGSVLFSLRCWGSLEQVCCFSGSNSAGKDLKHCLHLVPDPSGWRFIACGCYGVITFHIYMSSFNVKDLGTSYKLLPCCRARQTTQHTQRARGGVSSKGTDSRANESLLCLEDLSRLPRLCEVGHKSLCTLSCVSQAAPAIAGMAIGKIPPFPAGSVVSGLERQWGDKAQVTSLCHAEARCSFLQPPGEGGRAAALSQASKSFPHPAQAQRCWGCTLAVPRDVCFWPRDVPRDLCLSCPGMHSLCVL